MEQALLKLQKRLGYQFKNKALIIEALTHKSFKQDFNNERLEFLGDAVLGLVVGEYLYKKFSNVPEGDLSKMRASLVNEKGFERLAHYLKLGESIYISLAEENNRGREKASLLSNAFEALMGAVYLEAGLGVVQNIVIFMLDEVYPNISIETLFQDHKTALQEYTQAYFSVTPNYILVYTSGPDHKKEFCVSVSVGDRELAKAIGKSKKEAQQKAAKEALDMLKKDNS